MCPYLQSKDLEDEGWASHHTLFYHPHTLIFVTMIKSKGFVNEPPHFLGLEVPTMTWGKSGMPIFA